jgi:hypothetical protein
MDVIKSFVFCPHQNPLYYVLGLKKKQYIYSVEINL